MAVTILGSDTNRFYASGIPDSTVNFEKLVMETGGEHFKIRATGGTFVEWSWNGKEVAGRLEAGETETFPELRNGKIIYVRGDSTAKIWSWA